MVRATGLKERPYGEGYRHEGLMVRDTGLKERPYGEGYRYEGTALW